MQSFQLYIQFRILKTFVETDHIKIFKLTNLILLSKK